MAHRQKVEKDRGYIFEIVKANIIALIFALLAVLLSALAVKLFNISDGAIPIINQVIKTLAIFVGCIFSLKKPTNGWLRGIVCGFIFVWISYVVFSLLDGKFNVGLSMLNDCVLGMVAGMISGIISVNIRKRK
ncbi:MAG: TIGR04086 family membrane protein [Clostridia bacterium]|jgi:putative membrane protein (TIGR04086 family)|nr:TIGR04086 family membrane protein [Clostridia bacterium]MCI9459271.1 TIGR04086 family membrane protein [Clostridia bacterium]